MLDKICNCLMEWVDEGMSYVADFIDHGTPGILKSTASAIMEIVMSIIAFAVSVFLIPIWVPALVIGRRRARKLMCQEYETVRKSQVESEESDS